MLKFYHKTNCSHLKCRLQIRTNLFLLVSTRSYRTTHDTHQYRNVASIRHTYDRLPFLAHMHPVLGLTPPPNPLMPRPFTFIVVINL
jgi:hypothetical protein